MNDTKSPIIHAWDEKQLRDYFAAAALQALITNNRCYMATLDCAKRKNIEITEMAARAAYDYADAMLAERNK